ncbi:hypothetical protein HYY72_01955 [Candidatus Woesearchaeota archaeon]|nr:hypothetical protein [Candidatus Woesearchaeota archaeon]
MKTLIFDAGPVISLTMNNLLWVIEPLKRQFKGEFCITEAVKAELVDRPMNIRRFEFEALQVQAEIDCNILSIYKSHEAESLTNELLELANNCFSAKGQSLKIVHQGEMSTLASVLSLGADAVVIDERTTRELIEAPGNIANLMQSRLHTRIKVNSANLEKLKEKVNGIKVIRSVELVSVAFELGIINRYIERCKNPSPELRRRLLESVLWGVKLNGCAVGRAEIEQIMSSVLGNE